MSSLRGLVVCCALVASVARAVGQGAPAPESPDRSPQLSSPDGVPRGLAASDWSGIREAYEANRHAVYPLTVDPVAQQTYLKASNTGANDNFGETVAVSGNTVVVGAPDEDSSATGVNGDQGNDDVAQSGAAYVFVRDGTSWSQQAYLKASNTGANDEFGSAVAISGDTVVVGAFSEDSRATGVNGNQIDNTVVNSGAVYVFVRSGTTWSQQAYLKASNTDQGDRFGAAVDVSGDTVVVGALQEDSDAVGVDGDQGNDDAFDSGAAYVFVRSGTTWSQQAYLKASNTETVDLFGKAVAVSGDTVVVGAYKERSNATGVNGDQSNNLAPQSGAAYVFARHGTSWSQQAYLKASNTDTLDWFAFNVGVSGDTVVVGANFEDSNATGVNGNQNDDSFQDAGAVYVFVRNGTDWSQQAYLKASNAAPGDRFGWSVAVSGDALAVGALGEDSAPDVTGELSGAGAAYVFARNGTSWSQTAYLKAANADSGDQLGIWVSISGDTVVAGASGEDSNATGIDGNGSNDSALTSGAAYVFDVSPWTDLGSGLAGVSGVPNLVGTGTLVASSPTTLALSNAKRSSPAILFASLSSTPGAFKGGTLVPLPALLTVALGTLPDGTLPLPFTWPAGVPSATSLWFQYAISDIAAVQKVSLSNAVKATTP